MGHHLTREESKVIEEMIAHYSNRKIEFILDLTKFLIVCAFIFFFIILLQN